MMKKLFDKINVTTLIAVAVGMIIILVNLIKLVLIR